jgi:lipopolysaccharide biosynthesis glycosyltransferase
MSKNIIFMINIVHNERSKNQGYDWSIKSWQRYAQKYECELIVLDQLLFDISYMRPNWYKMYILDILEENGIDYDQVMYVDSDTIVTDNAPNIFDYTDHRFCAIRNIGDMDWILRSIENYSKFMFNGFMFPYYKYFNSGVMVFNKKHRDFFKSLQSFYEKNQERIVWMQSTFGVGTDQPIFNVFVNRDIPDDFKLLEYEWNAQDMVRLELLSESMLHTDYAYICHFNSGVSPTPAFWMEKTYKFMYE